MLTSRALFFLLVANGIGGASYLATVYALRGFSVGQSVLWRTLAAALLFVPQLAGARRADLDRRDWVLMAGVGLLGYAAPIVLGTFGLAASTATHGVLLVGMEPVMIVLLAALFLGERLTPLKLLALALGLGGAAMIVSQGRWTAPPSESGRLMGDLLLAMTGFFWSLYTLMGKPVLRRLEAGAFTAVTTWIGLAPVAAAAWLKPGAAPSGPVPWEAWGGQAFLMAASYGGALAWNKAVELVPASRVANFVFVQPLVGVLLGVLVGREALTAWTAAGGLLVVLGATAAAKEES